MKKTKYFKITPEMLQGTYNVDLHMEGTVPFREIFVEYKGKKYRCTKIGNEEWREELIDDFPFYPLPKDFKKLASQKPI